MLVANLLLNYLEPLDHPSLCRDARELNLNDTEIAERLGISKARMSQVRKSGPSRARVFFGVGPISVGVPYRYQTTDRSRPLIAAEDAQTAEQLTILLESMSFSTSRYQIQPEQSDAPDGDTVIVCGPKSVPIGDALLKRDSALRMIKADRRWWIEQIAAGEGHGSPVDDTVSRSADVAYIARHVLEGRVIVHIAGIHGSGRSAPPTI
jgi:hypothetical protein